MQTGERGSILMDQGACKQSGLCQPDSACSNGSSAIAKSDVISAGLYKNVAALQQQRCSRELVTASLSATSKALLTVMGVCSPLCLLQPTCCDGAVLIVFDIDGDAGIGALRVGLRVASSQLGFIVLQDLCRTPEQGHAHV